MLPTELFLGKGLYLHDIWLFLGGQGKFEFFFFNSLKVLLIENII